jgi:hypothetical protein
MIRPLAFLLLLLLLPGSGAVVFAQSSTPSLDLLVLG